MRLYLVQVKGQARAKTLALRFLTSAQRLDETSYEKKIRDLKKNSVFLFPSLDLKTKKGNSKSSFNRNRPAILLNKPVIINAVEGEDKSMSSEGSIKEVPIEEVKTDIIMRESNLDGSVVRKPIFQYIPEDIELRKMIRKGVFVKDK